MNVKVIPEKVDHLASALLVGGIHHLPLVSHLQLKEDAEVGVPPELLVAVGGYIAKVSPGEVLHHELGLGHLPELRNWIPLLSLTS